MMKTMSAIHKKIKQEEHSHCFLCGHSNKKGFKLDFDLVDDGSMEACFRCSDFLEGYNNVMHGGVVSALLDSVMTNCLFARGIKALTAELNVRFLAPVKTEGVVRLKASIEKSSGSYYVLRASLVQGQTLKAKATGKFIAFLKNPEVKNDSTLKEVLNAT